MDHGREKVSVNCNIQICTKLRRLSLVQPLSRTHWDTYSSITIFISRL